MNIFGGNSSNKTKRNQLKRIGLLCFMWSLLMLWEILLAH